MIHDRQHWRPVLFHLILKAWYGGRPLRVNIVIITDRVWVTLVNQYMLKELLLFLEFATIAATKEGEKSGPNSIPQWVMRRKYSNILFYIITTFFLLNKTKSSTCMTEKNHNKEKVVEILLDQLLLLWKMSLA